MAGNRGVKAAASMKDIPPSKASRGSPLKHRKPTGEIQQTKLPPGWHLHEILCEGHLTVIQITNSSMTQDAFSQPLTDALANREPTQQADPIKDNGIVGSYFMRKSLEDGDPLMNAKNGYQRKAFVRVLDEDETSLAHRLQGLNVIKEFLERTENNRYGTRVYIPADWDLTPPEPNPLPKLDHFLQYREIVNVIKDIFDNVDGNWAVNNMESATAFFTEGHIPFAANTDIGFPMDLVIQNNIRN